MSALEVIELDPSKAHMLPYAPAVRVPAVAEYLFLSGAVAADDEEYPEDIAEQVRRAENRRLVLWAIGAYTHWVRIVPERITGRRISVIE